MYDVNGHDRNWFIDVDDDVDVATLLVCMVSSSSCLGRDIRLIGTCSIDAFLVGIIGKGPIEGGDNSSDCLNLSSPL